MPVSTTEKILSEDYFDLIVPITGSDTDFEEAIALTESTFAMPRTDVPKGSIHYICGVNHSRIFGISLVPEGDRLVMELDCDFGKQRIVCGNGEYVFSSIASMCLAPAIIQLHRYGEIEPFNAPFRSPPHPEMDI